MFVFFRFPLQHLKMYGLSLVSFPFGPEIFQNLLTLNLQYVTSLNMYTNIYDESPRLRFPSLREFTLCISCKGYKEIINHFCDSDSFVNVEILNIEIPLFRESGEIITLNLKQYFPRVEKVTFYSSSPASSLGYYEEHVLLINVIAGDSIKSLDINITKGFFPEYISISNSHSLAKINFTKTSFSSSPSHYQCISLMTKKKITFNQLTNPDITVHFDVEDALEFEETCCNPLLTIALQESVKTNWLLSTRSQIYRATKSLLKVAQTIFQYHENIHINHFESVSFKVKNLKTSIETKLSRLKGSLQMREELQQNIIQMQQRYMEITKDLERIRSWYSSDIETIP